MKLKTSLALLVASLCTALLIYTRTKEQIIKVGVLHSKTGTLAISELPVVDATLLAIEEINNNGGLLGKRIVPIVADGKSDPDSFAKEAERLIAKQHVSAIFGCWTSASRKSVKSVVEKHNHILLYPVQYEGVEQSPNIIYTGAAPNQQIIPGVTWCFNNLGKRFFLVGSDYIFPRMANEIIKEHILSLGGEVVGEEYILLGSKDVKNVIEKIVTTQPTVILNTINGDSNIPFFKELRAAAITPEKIPTMSFSISEGELLTLDPRAMAGDYATWNYFQNALSKENLEFIRNFKKKYGEDRVTSDPMEAAYFGVKIWAKALEDANKDNPQAVLQSIKGQTVAAPEGMVAIDSENQHSWKHIRVGKILSSGQFLVVWDSKKAIKPNPYPIYKSKKEWERLMVDFYESWGKKWVREK